MMDLEKVVREAVARETAPLLAQCEQLCARIERIEGDLPIEVMMRRAELEAIISKLQSDDLVEDALRLARARWPSFRIH
jgi:hypothetical protein